jgi:hypothetical protein
MIANLRKFFQIKLFKVLTLFFAISSCSGPSITYRANNDIWLDQKPKLLTYTTYTKVIRYKTTGNFPREVCKMYVGKDAVGIILSNLFTLGLSNFLSPKREALTPTISADDFSKMVNSKIDYSSVKDYSSQFASEEEFDNFALQNPKDIYLKMNVCEVENITIEIDQTN